MKDLIKTIFEQEKIEYFGIIPFSSCKIINQSLYEREISTWTPKSVVVMIVPYYSGEHKERNISLYAVPRDYHLYFKELYAHVIPKLKEKYPFNNFKPFADHSPIGETTASAKAGLGIIGDKHQLINEKYGSHVFIGEIITDVDFDSYDENIIKYCDHCGACINACPSDSECFSAITQKKGILSYNDEQLIINQKCVWGCDRCRDVCQYNRNAQITPIDFFKSDLISVVDEEIIENMSKDEFKSRAYGWRGKNTIIRNIKLLGK